MEDRQFSRWSMGADRERAIADNIPPVPPCSRGAKILGACGPYRLSWFERPGQGPKLKRRRRPMHHPRPRSSHEFAAAAKKLRQWLFEVALPRWRRLGADPVLDGYHEGNAVNLSLISKIRPVSPVRSQD